MKKKIEKWKIIVENKILHILKKRVEVATLLTFMLIEMAVIAVINYNKVSYRYIDMDGNVGQSNNCYYNDIYREIQCDIPTKVSQYEKRK